MQTLNSIAQRPNLASAGAFPGRDVPVITKRIRSKFVSLCFGIAIFSQVSLSLFYRLVGK